MYFLSGKKFFVQRLKSVVGAVPHDLPPTEGGISLTECTRNVSHLF